MPRIFDNIELQRLPALKETLHLTNRTDFCVGYFNLRNWKHLDSNRSRYQQKESQNARRT